MTGAAGTKCVALTRTEMRLETFDLAAFDSSSWTMALSWMMTMNFVAMASADFVVVVVVAAAAPRAPFHPPNPYRSSRDYHQLCCQPSISLAVLGSAALEDFVSRRSSEFEAFELGR